MAADRWKVITNFPPGFLSPKIACAIFAFRIFFQNQDPESETDPESEKETESESDSEAEVEEESAAASTLSYM